MSELRVLANLCAVVAGQVGGSEAYATRLLAAVAARPADETPAVSLEVASMAGLRQAHPELSGLRWHETRWDGQPRWRRAAIESTWLAQRSRGFDLVHHFSGRLPARRRCVTVLTVHDIQPLDMPENFSLTKRRYLAWSLPRSVRSATLVTVPSQWVAQRIVDRLQVSEDRIRVVPSTYTAVTAPQSRTPMEVSESAESCGEGLDDRVFGAPFLLYPAATYPHKNHETLIAAFAAVRQRHHDLTLVLTGGAGRSHAQVMELVARTPGAVHLGMVERDHLARLTAKATAVAFPSRYEGFGLPVLEAMYAGTAVIASASTALPEVLGDAATLVAPDDADGWVDGLLEACSESAATRQAVERGRIRAARFAPEKSAQRLMQAWQDAIGLEP